MGGNQRGKANSEVPPHRYSGIAYLRHNRSWLCQLEYLDGHQQVDMPCRCPNALHAPFKPLLSQQPAPVGLVRVLLDQQPAHRVGCYAKHLPYKHAQRSS